MAWFLIWKRVPLCILTFATLCLHRYTSQFLSPAIPKSPYYILCFCRGQPPDYLLKGGKNTNKFFKFVGNVDHIVAGHLSVGGGTTYQVLTEEEYETREKKKPVIGKEYFNYMNLEGIVAAYPYRKNLPEEDNNREKQVRLALIDFLRGLVEFDPAKRWSPFQASNHPFVMGEPFTSPYKPPPETPRVVPQTLIFVLNGEIPDYLLSKNLIMQDMTCRMDK